jgi:hypothetical protein
LAYGWFFGFGRGVILVSFASTAGATIAFLLSRYLLRDTIQNKFGDRLAGFNKALEREGAFYLFTLRLIPVMPFFVFLAQSCERQFTPVSRENETECRNHSSQNEQFPKSGKSL